MSEASSRQDLEDLRTRDAEWAAAAAAGEDVDRIVSFWSETTQFEVAEEGDLAYGVGRNRVTFPGEDGELRTVEGRGVTVWRKENGEWRCVVDIWNDAPPSE